VSVSDASPLTVELAPTPMASRDSWGDWRRTVARAVSLLMHSAAIALFLVHGPAGQQPPEPQAIPVELVVEPPPKPKAAIAPQLKLAPVPQPTPQAEHRESGGDPDRAQGRPPEAKPPEPAKRPGETQPPPKAQPPMEAKQKSAQAPPKPIPAPKPPPTTVDKAARQVAAIPPASPSKAREPAPTTAPPGRGSAPAQIESSLRGQGGGDRYLNALRDDIVSNIIYPAAARGAVGVAKYTMIVSRKGYLLQLRLLQSSGSAALDRAGMDAIQNTAPFRPLPANVIGDSVEIVGTLYIAP